MSSIGLQILDNEIILAYHKSYSSEPITCKRQFYRNI